MPNCSPMAWSEPKTATRSFVFMTHELSTLCNGRSSPLIARPVNLAYMSATLRDRLIEIADQLGNDAEFARIAKVSRSAVSQWRAGDVKALKALSALNIQERTGYSARWLVLGIGPKKLLDKALERRVRYASEHCDKIVAGQRAKINPRTPGFP